MSYLIEYFKLKFKHLENKALEHKIIKNSCIDRNLNYTLKNLF